MSALTLTASEAAKLLGYSQRTFVALVRRGILPAPIDPTLPTRSQRWSRPTLLAYVGAHQAWNGEVA